MSKIIWRKRDSIASLYKKYRRRVNKVDDRIDTALAMASFVMAASGTELLATIIAVPIALGIQAGSTGCGLLGAGCKLIGWRLHVKAKHDQIRVLTETKLNIIKGHI